MSGDPPEPPREPVFFVSYARARAAPHGGPVEENRPVIQFFTDLAALVDQLIALPRDQDVGFMDTTLNPGGRWEKQLLEKVGTCQVLICLLSPRYLMSSEWCAMEWDIFQDRKVVQRANGEPAEETAIVPVLWVPILDRVPDRVNEITRFAPQGLPESSTAAAQLRNEGLYGLFLTDKDAYRAVVWKLALHIQRLHTSYQVLPKVLTSTEGLRRSFQDGTP